MSRQIRVAGPAEILSVIAYRLGFQPTDSLALVSIRDDNRVGVIVRADLDEIAHTLRKVVSLVIHDGARRMVVVAYTDDSTRARDLLVDFLTLPDVDVEAIHVTSTGYRHPLDDTYAPISDLQSTEAAATFVSEGAALVDTPDQLLPQPANPTARTIARKAAATAHEDGLRALAAWLREPGNTTTYTDPEALGRLAGYLANRQIRDAVLLAMFGGPAAIAYAAAIDEAPDSAVQDVLDDVLRPGGRHPGPDLADWLDLLAAVVGHHADCAAGAPAWTLWALAQWWSGNGAAASRAIGRARALDPEYRLATLIHALLDAGIGPGYARR